jgi:cytochrome b6-f complex iron-sulfur subunit
VIGVAPGALYPVGRPITATGWLAQHGQGDRSLVQGFKGDPIDLIVVGDGAMGSDGINAIGTHLGCVVPWNGAAGKFIRPCHGSQYDPEGGVVRGPAPHSLALAQVQVENDQVALTSWSETDFRDGSRPWWG